MTPSEAQRQPPQSADFGIEVGFVSNTADPSRVFRTTTRLIEACEFMDDHFAAAFSANIKPLLLLESIEAGSITTWLRSVVQSVDDEALKSGDWKKFVGAFLVKGKRNIVTYLEGRETIINAGEIYDLQKVLHDAARQTDVPLSTDPPIPARSIGESIRVLADATTSLLDGDTARYLSQEGDVPINTKFRVTAERIEEILTQETIKNNDVMILKVKKPDFLGESMWDFRYEGKRLVAKLQDEIWLRQFHDGEVVLRPGDALRGLVEVETKYGQDKEVIAVHHKVLKVEQVIHKNA